MSLIRKPAPTHPDAESLLGSLAGILSVHITREAGGRIAEIHILASSSIHPKQVVRNVESALSAGMGIQIDRRIVSVAQVRTAADENGNGAVAHGAEHPEQSPRLDEAATATADPEHRPPARRLEFVRFEARRQDDRCACDVVLRDGGADGAEHLGRGTAGDSAGGRAEAAARAVLDAIGAARPDLTIELDGANLSSARGRTFVIVAAHVLLDRELVRLAGASPLTRSPEEAAILATLQATNRWSG
jgi:hypothetical protein